VLAIYSILLNRAIDSEYWVGVPTQHKP